MIRDIACEWSLVTAPAEEPLTLAEAKLHASITQDDDNLLTDAYRVAARQAAEQYLGRGLFTQTWQAQLAYWAEVIWLPMAAPLQSVTSVKYYDGDGVLQTLAASSYVVDTTSEPGRIYRAPNTAWPSVQADRLVRVIVTYVCGWTSVDTIPELIKQGIRLYLATSDADRVGADSAAAKAAAEACWRAYGQVFWRPPEPYQPIYGRNTTSWPW